jgi:hypothetical protein
MAQNVLMAMKRGRNNRVLIDQRNKRRRCTTAVRFGSAAAVNTLYTIFRAVKENEGMNQSQALGIRQTLVHKGIFRAR